MIQKKKNMLHIWSTVWIPHFTTYNFPLFQKTDWSRMPTGDKHITKYLVCIFPTLHRKFLFLLCIKSTRRPYFQHLNQWRNNCK